MLIINAHHDLHIVNHINNMIRSIFYRILCLLLLYFHKEIRF